MKSNTIKTVLVTLMVVMIIWLLAEYGEKLEEEENKYNVETSTSKPAATASPSQTEEFNMDIPDSLYDNNGYLKKDKLMDKVVQIVHDNWEYSDFDYNPDNDVLDIHFGNPSDTDGINATQYDAKLMQKWAIEIQPSVKSLNLVLLDVFRSHGYQTHVNLYYHNGFQHENIILATMDGKVMYDYFLNIDAQ